MKAVLQNNDVVLVETDGTAKDADWRGYPVNVPKRQVFPKQNLHSAISHRFGEWIKPQDGERAVELAKAYEKF